MGFDIFLHIFICKAIIAFQIAIGIKNDVHDFSAP